MSTTVVLPLHKNFMPVSSSFHVFRRLSYRAAKLDTGQKVPTSKPLLSSGTFKSRVGGQDFDVEEERVAAADEYACHRLTRFQRRTGARPSLGFSHIAEDTTSVAGIPKTAQGAVTSAQNAIQNATTNTSSVLSDTTRDAGEKATQALQDAKQSATDAGKKELNKATDEVSSSFRSKFPHKTYTVYVLCGE
eukprot:COSAG03_NODE_2478_length_2716_cov_1.976309_1_plen_191_part_00